MIQLLQEIVITFWAAIAAIVWAYGEAQLILRNVQFINTIIFKGLKTFALALAAMYAVQYQFIIHRYDQIFVAAATWWFAFDLFLNHFRHLPWLHLSITTPSILDNWVGGWFKDPKNYLIGLKWIVWFASMVISYLIGWWYYGIE